ncbi:polysaccharide deacetylase family protein [Paenibacillus pinistramenti]|uniref:polysaccharide deacetylase family protein n=1 Tax=Paenibacillus pinistramenti TaxID=1768003 RepID=UPI00110842F9|nr:polysaccharide deacetylase family protein [Paenibacillus pinistramenti]
MEKHSKRGKKKRNRISLTRINILLGAAVVVLAAFSIQTARTESSSSGAITVSSPALGANPKDAGSLNQTVEKPSSPAASSASSSTIKVVNDKKPQAPSPSAASPSADPGTASKTAAAPKANESADQPLLPKDVKSKTVYLTFDDGPSRYTDQIAAILAKNKIHSTFFVIGSNLTEYSKKVTRLLAQGHYVGLHSMTHSYSKLYKSGSSANFIKEFQQEQALYKKITGQEVDLIRAPYGSAPQISKTFRDDIAAAGFRMWDWTVDSEDWSYKNHPEKIIAQVKRQVHGNLNVILMHETKQTVEALPQVIAYLKQQGYSFAVYKPSQHLVVNFADDKRL